MCDILLFSDAESRDIKSLTRFPWNPILEILVKKYYCVGRTKMRGRFLMKMCPNIFYNCPVIFRCFLGQVYLILTEPTQLSTHVNPIKHVIAFSYFLEKKSRFSKPQQICAINLINVAKGKWTLTFTRWLSRDGECDLLVPPYVIFTQLFKWKKVFLMTDRIWNNLSVKESIVQIIPDM